MKNIIKHPVSTEKAVRLMEADNKLVFMVERKATKQDIKKEIEKMFDVKVVKVNTLINAYGEKKAYVKLSKENKAIDVATKLGFM
ncbi:MAG: 50S ribosomal protein L23 [Nanoarchaeota archaeon]